MTDTKIYITIGTASDILGFGLGQQHHIGIIIVKDGVTYQIDGNQSVGFGNPNRIELAVNTQHDPIFGNIIVETIEISGVAPPEFLTALGAVEVVGIPEAEIDSKAQAILDSVATVGSGVEYTHIGVTRTYFDYDIGYFPITQNSNSVANTLLSAGGISLQALIQNFSNIRSCGQKIPDESMM